MHQMQFHDSIVATKHWTAVADIADFLFWLLPPLHHSNDVATTTAYCGYLNTAVAHCITAAGEKPPASRRCCLCPEVTVLCFLLAINVIDCWLFNIFVNSPSTIAVCMSTGGCLLAVTADWLLFFLLMPPLATQQHLQVPQCCCHRCVTVLVMPLLLLLLC